MSRRALLWCALVPFLLVQAWFTVGPGGIMDVYGFWNGFPKFVSLSLADPLLTTGFVDFLVVAVFGYAWLAHDLPAANRWGPRTWIWTVSYIVFPGLGFFVYFLWLNPGHPLMRASQARA